MVKGQQARSAPGNHAHCRLDEILQTLMHAKVDVYPVLIDHDSIIAVANGLLCGVASQCKSVIVVLLG